MIQYLVAVDLGHPDRRVLYDKPHPVVIANLQRCGMCLHSIDHIDGRNLSNGISGRDFDATAGYRVAAAQIDRYRVLVSRGSSCPGNINQIDRSDGQVGDLWRLAVGSNCDRYDVAGANHGDLVGPTSAIDRLCRQVSSRLTNTLNRVGSRESQ